MRHTILSRSAVAVASIAIGSAALAAVPANAETAPSVTRDQVITAIDGVRAAQADNTERSRATNRALRQIVEAGCDLDGDSYNDQPYFQSAQLTDTGDDAEGIVITAYVYDYFTNDNSRYQLCTVAAFAPRVAGFTLSGTATIDGTRNVYDASTNQTTPTPESHSYALSGQAYVTPGVYSNYYNDRNTFYDATSTANGNVSKTVKVKEVKRVKDKKGTAEKRAAKDKYRQRIAAAKRAYAKALDKADNRSERGAAKKEYKADRASALSKYRYARADYKLVTKRSSVTTTLPFSITTKQAEEPQQPQQPDLG